MSLLHRTSTQIPSVWVSVDWVEITGVREGWEEMLNTPSFPPDLTFFLHLGALLHMNSCNDK